MRARTTTLPATTLARLLPNMTVTYDPTLADSVSEVRFYIGDTNVGSGPRPGVPAPTNSNFSDAEITAMLSKASGSVESCVGKLFSVLSAEWSRYATNITVGPYKEDLTKLADKYATQAKEWTDLALQGSHAFSSGVIRRPSSDLDSRSLT